jgi:Putative MetA-pathway of phenol degradation
MFKRLLVGSALCILFSYSDGRAQGVCPLDGTLSNKLVCVLPQTFGARGFGGGEGAPLKFNFGHEGHFDSDFLSSFGPINEAVGIQVSQLPIASPSSSITFIYDPALKTFAPATEQSLGPILGERASTIGRRKLYIAFSFQYFNFNSIDGQNTSHVPAVFKHLPVAPSTNPFSPSFLHSCPNQDGLTGSYAGDPCFVRDFIQTTNNIDLTVHQYTLYATYGITRHLDFSVAVPILNISMKVDSNATIVQNSFGPGGSAFHQFDPTVVTSCGSTSPCLNGAFSSSGSASGIGDVVLRGKYELYHGERFGFATGVDVRLPTGDEQNFLGSGAIGVRPFGVISYGARISPHAEVGYEVNGKSILAGNFVATNTNTKAGLPDRFVYIVGADASIIKRLTGSFDIYGQRLFGVPQLFSSSFTDFGKCSDINCTTLTPGTMHPDVAIRGNVDYNIINASVGLKYRLFSHLVLTGNVLLKLNDSGLRATAVPLVGVSYSY